MPTAIQASLSIGYAGTFGGVQKLDGVPTGAKTDEQQIRLSYSQFITPTWQGVRVHQPRCHSIRAIQAELRPSSARGETVLGLVAHQQ
jgi:hypothetical protein